MRLLVRWLIHAAAPESPADVVGNVDVSTFAPLSASTKVGGCLRE